MENLDRLTGFLLDTLKETKGFVAEQAPDFVRQMLEYAAFDAKMGMAFWIVMSLFGVFLLYKALTYKNEYSRSSDGIFGCILLGIILFVFGLFGTVNNFTTLKKIQIAPKVYIMEKISEATSNKCSK